MLLREPMRLILRLLAVFGGRRKARAGYGAEVLFAGWVELPAAFRDLVAHRGPAGSDRRSLHA
jgi:hypothetical protein